MRGDTNEPIKLSDARAEKRHRRTNKAVRRRGLHHSAPFYTILQHFTPFYTILQTEGLRGDTDEPIKLPDKEAERGHIRTNKAVRRRGLHHCTPFYTILYHFTQFYAILHLSSEGGAERGHRRTNKAVRRKGSTPFYTILHHSTPFYTILYHSTPFYTILHHSSDGGADRGHRRTNKAVRRRG